MKIIVNVQSFSDVITNSSSELFTVKNVDNTYELKKLIEEIGEQNWYKGSWEDWDNMSPEEQRKYDSCSGDGGNITIKTWKEVYERYKSCIPKNKQDLYTPEMWSVEFEDSLEDLKHQLWIDIDHSRYATIEWILKNLFVSNADDGYYRIDPNTGRYLERVTWDEWTNLPTNERN